MRGFHRYHKDMDIEALVDHLIKLFAGERYRKEVKRHCHTTAPCAIV